MRQSDPFCGLTHPSWPSVARRRGSVERAALVRDRGQAPQVSLDLRVDLLNDSDVAMIPERRRRLGDRRQGSDRGGACFDRTSQTFAEQRGGHARSMQQRKGFFARRASRELSAPCTLHASPISVPNRRRRQSAISTRQSAIHVGLVLFAPNPSPRCHTRSPGNSQEVARRVPSNS